MVHRSAFSFHTELLQPKQHQNALTLAYIVQLQRTHSIFHSSTRSQTDSKLYKNTRKITKLRFKRWNKNFNIRNSHHKYEQHRVDWCWTNYSNFLQQIYPQPLLRATSVYYSDMTSSTYSVLVHKREMNKKNGYFNCGYYNSQFQSQKSKLH